MKQEDLDKEVAEHRRLHIMDVFSREFMSTPVSKEDAAFKQSYFRRYRETDKEFQDKLEAGNIESILLCDPSKSAKMHNASSAIVIYGIDGSSEMVYLRGVYSGFWTPSELYKWIIDKAVQFGVSVIGIETTGIDMFITQPFRDYMASRKVFFQFEELRAKSGKGELAGLVGGKKGRARGLLPYYERGLIIHNEACCGPIEQALMSFPRPKRWDVIDAASYLPYILDAGSRILGAGYNEGGEDYDEVEAEYAELYSNSPRSFDSWRMV